MESHLQTTFGDRLTEIELVASSGGCFEVDRDGRRVYSKLETGEFPENEAIGTLVTEALAAV